MDITRNDVSNVLRNLKTVYYLAPDGIPSAFLKKCISFPLIPLQLLFSRSIKEGVFPEKLKYSFINPVFKEGNRSLIGNYRPIKMNISPKQDRFMPGRSVVSNFLEVSNQATQVFQQGVLVDVVYLDLKKAFDSVDHCLLIDKLRRFGIQGSFLQWFKSYLTD